jgi:hypothetical protein
MAFLEKEYDLDTKSSTFTLGKTETDAGTVLEFDTSELPEDIRTQLMLHGLNQKLGDGVASIKGKLAKDRGVETKDIPDAEVLPLALESINASWAQMLAGDWRAAKGESEAKPRVGEVAQALARLQSISVEQAQSLIAQVDKAKLATWRAHPQMKLAIAQIRQERAQARLAAEVAKAGSMADFNPNA